MTIAQKNDLSQYIMRCYVEIRNDLYYIDIAKPLQNKKNIIDKNGLKKAKIIEISYYFNII